MAECFAGGRLRFVYGEWRDDDGNAIEISRVRHGRWQFEKTYQGMKYVCSECGEIPECFEPYYCPNCGAKMDAED